MSRRNKIHKLCLFYLYVPQSFTLYEPFFSTKLNFCTPANYESFLTSHPLPPQHNNPTGRYSSVITIKIKNKMTYLKSNYSKLGTLYVSCCTPHDYFLFTIIST